MGRLSDNLVVIDLSHDPATARVHGPYRMNPIVKNLFWRARRWDNAAGCWLVDAAYVRALADDLIAANLVVDIHDEDGTIRTDIGRRGWGA